RLLHLGEELPCALSYFLLGEVLRVCAQAPGVSERVHEGAVAITPELVGHRHCDLTTRIYCPLKCSIDILYIEIQSARSAPESLRGFISQVRHLIGKENNGIADFQFSMADAFPIRTRHAHDFLSA